MLLHGLPTAPWLPGVQGEVKEDVYVAQVRLQVRRLPAVVDPPACVLASVPAVPRACTWRSTSARLCDYAGGCRTARGTGAGGRRAAVTLAAAVPHPATMPCCPLLRVPGRGGGAVCRNGQGQGAGHGPHLQGKGQGGRRQGSALRLCAARAMQRRCDVRAFPVFSSPNLPACLRIAGGPAHRLPCLLQGRAARGEDAQALR